tara:strand:- start:21841 stop:25335 length:3495 start_codon:yes stop_codon:yes gene_type:complete
MRTIPLLILSAAFLHAAPSTDLGNEIQVPLESSSSIALIDKSSGSIRLIHVNASNSVILTQPKHTSLPDVTGVTSGLTSGGSELLILTSPTANRATRFDTTTFVSTPIFLSQVGPQFPAIVKKSPAGPEDLLLAHTFNNSSDPFLTLHRDPSGKFKLLDDASGSDSVSTMQPFYISGSAERYVVGVANDGVTNRLFYGNINGADTIVYNTSNLIPVGTLLASNVRRDDGLLMLVGYVPGSPNISIIPANAPPALGAPVTRTLTFEVGNVSAAPSGFGPAGILVTSADGSEAVHYSITAANTLNKVQSFSPSGADPIHGLLTVPSRGIIQLTGPAGKLSSDFSFSAWDGASWKQRAQGTLPAPTTPTPEFATLFWFSAEPLVDPTAQLLKLETAPDWTSKSSAIPIPANVFTETYLGPSAGLASPIPFVPTAPAGATHLVTNQFLDSISLASLDSNLALTLPPLSVSPDSGSYTQPVFLKAQTDDDLYDIYFRNGAAGYEWQFYTNPLTISYSSTWQFYAKNKGSGTNGPITSRSYTFDTVALATFDSDHDGIPDFVEAAYGLNPLAGPDTDADGYSDLDELLNNSNPNAQISTPPSTSPFHGEGFLILTQAFNTTPDKASDGDPASPANLTDGTIISLYGMTSNFLAVAPIEPLSTPASLAGDLAATLKIGTPIPAREWLTLSSPQYFDIDGVAPQVRSGREIYKIIQRPVQAPPVISAALTGLDQQVDASTWLAAAQAAYGSYEQVSSITPLEPTDTAVAILGEASLYDALRSLDASQQTALSVPQDIASDPNPPVTPAIPGYAQFTLFGKRDGDASRTAFTGDMRDALLADGLSLEELLTDINAEVSISANLLALTNALYDFHVAHSEPTAALPEDIIPLLPLPLDILRGVARGEALPSDYAGVVTAPVFAAAQNEMTAVLALLANAYRPSATWTIEVSAPVILGEKYAYIHTGSLSPVALYEADGDPLSLDQGLGLSLGTRFSVTGYTDAVGPVGHIAMELLSINVLFVPAASDSDTDGNLLADDWEKFFFGNTGVVNPYDTHPVNGYSYLQLYIIGHDPRADSTEIPTVPIATLAPDQMTIIKLPSGNYALNFIFPDTYFSSFEFDVENSTTLMNFQPLTTANPSKIGVDTYQIDLGNAASSVPVNYFRITMFLSDVGNE